MRNWIKYWKNLTLMQEITVILVLKILVIMLIWWLFFRGQKVEVTPESVLDAPALQTNYHQESK